MSTFGNLTHSNLEEKVLPNGTKLADVIKPARYFGHPIREGDCWVGTTFSEKFNHFLKSRLAHKIILVLVLLDLAFVVSGIFFELHHLSSEVHDMEEVLEEYHHHGCVVESLHSSTDTTTEPHHDSKTTTEPHHDRRNLNEEVLVCEIEEEYGTPWLKDAEEICAILSFVILSIFLVENLAMMLSEGTEFFTDCGTNAAHWFDLIIVIISFSLEAYAIFGSEDSDDPFQLLIIGRLWRLGRIGEGVFEAAEEKKELKGETEMEASGGKRMP